MTGLRLLRHELRTPLTGIRGMAELLAESGLAGEQRKLLLALQESCRQMERLIEQIGVGGGVPGNEPIDGLQLLEQVIRAHWPAALKQGIGLYLLFDHRLRKNWCSDRTGLRQLIDNLLANAIKFTHHGHVLIHARPSGCNRPGLELRVCDTGIGIARSDSRQIYADFKQGSGGIQRRYGGSGLGLSVCRHIAASLGGSVRHQPNPGGGTCFRLLLPGIADTVPNSNRRLRPGLLAGLRCRLGLRKPRNLVVTQWLLRMGVQVERLRNDELHDPSVGCDFMICDASRIGKPIRGSQAADALDRPVLLSRWLRPDVVLDGDERETNMLELPQPLLYSSLEPMVLQLALARAMLRQARSGME